MKKGKFIKNGVKESKKVKNKMNEKLFQNLDKQVIGNYSKRIVNNFFYDECEDDD